MEHPYRTQAQGFAPPPPPPRAEDPRALLRRFAGEIPEYWLTQSRIDPLGDGMVLKAVCLWAQCSGCGQEFVGAQGQATLCFDCDTLNSNICEVVEFTVPYNVLHNVERLRWYFRRFRDAVLARRPWDTRVYR